MSFRPRYRVPSHRPCDYCGSSVPRSDVWPLMAEREDDDGLVVIHGRFCAGCREHLADMGFTLGSA